ncbi:hypothetical protein SAMN04487820_104169 [Actinopolyspora mzabensis]|uniref:VanZ like family protein n=1 Tax=Actinopolyspora mzabensis TaxID=995066 RepID=A0A1G8Z147_ACTMZ|nr:hypothetical protein [Actinopolyspora mzabensis]SDK08697.1 hypothetical protein SAMN04487820_104169 [Actinopolyspora mzabensis]
MLDPFSPRTHRALFVVSCVASLVILFTPPAGVPDSPPGTDKLVHLALFAVMTVTGRAARVDPRLLLPCLAGYAPLSEALQQLLPVHRDADVLDTLADLSGIAVGHALVVASRRITRGTKPRNSHVRVSKHRSRSQPCPVNHEPGSRD